MLLIWSSLTTPKHNIHLFPFISLSAGRSFMLEFLCWSSKDIWFGAFQIALACSVICCSDFVFQERSLFADLREISGNDDEHGSWFRFAGCCWYHDGFFQTTAGVCSDQGQWINLNFLRFFDRFGRFCLLLCLCIILTWNPIDYRLKPLLLVVHQRIYWCCISSLCL